MLARPMRTLHTLIAWAALTVGTAFAQDDLEKDEAKLSRTATRMLIQFARTAELNGADPHARDAFRLIIEHYDADHRAAREALGYREVDERWEPPSEKPSWRSTSDSSQRRRVNAAWGRVCKNLAKRHRELGLAAEAVGESEISTRHFELAVHFDPNDRVSHEALGHSEFEGFFGDEEQIGFLERMAAIRARARELLAEEIEIEQLPASRMPAPLRSIGVEMTGARANGFDVWTQSEQEHTDEVARYAARTTAMLQFLMGDDHESLAALRKHALYLSWVAVVRGPAERDAFFDRNPQVLGDQQLTNVKRFTAFRFKDQGGRAELAWGRVEWDFDFIVAHTTQRTLAGFGNTGFGEGLVHTMTWLLVGTMWTRYGALPATESGEKDDLLYDPDGWFGRLRESIRDGKDWPLAQVPRERYERFRPEVRIKSWSFVTWLLARHPDRWTRVLRIFSDEVVPLPEQVIPVLAEALGRDVYEVEAEWREWANGESRIAEASGFAGR